MPCYLFSVAYTAKSLHTNFCIFKSEKRASDRKHHKMSNENFKHHENQEKVEGGLTRTFQGTLFLILLCKKKILFNQPYNQIFFSQRKAKKKSSVQIMLKWQQKIIVLVGLIKSCCFFAKQLTTLFPESPRYRWDGYHPHSPKSPAPVGWISPSHPKLLAPVGWILRSTPLER